MHKSLRPVILLVFIDFLLNLSMWLLLLSNPVAKHTNNQNKPVAAYTIYMTWETGLDVDMDIWLLMPNGEKVSYTHKDAGVITLERDDLGAFSGQNQLNLEIINMREPPDGDYIISIYTYSTRVPIQGNVTVEIYNSSGGNVFTRTMPMPPLQQEAGVAVFHMQDIVLSEPRNSTLIVRNR